MISCELKIVKILTGIKSNTIFSRDVFKKISDQIEDQRDIIALRSKQLVAVIPFDDFSETSIKNELEERLNIFSQPSDAIDGVNLESPPVVNLSCLTKPCSMLIQQNNEVNL